MRRKATGYFIALCTAIFFFAAGATAQSGAVNVVTTAVPFLRISPDARSGGMGDVGIAMSPDANAAFWNRAKTPFAKKTNAIGLTYTPWLQDLGVGDVFLASLAGYHKIGDDQAISASMRYFSLGSIQFTDFAGNPLNSFRPKEFCIDFGYSLKLSPNLGLGLALRYINSSLANGSVNGVSYKAGNAVAGDITLFHDGTESGTKQGLNWGITLSNLGSKIGYTNDAQNKDYIPANMGLGVAYTKIFDESNKMTFGLDVNKLLVPAPPVATNNFSTDSAALADYRNSSVISSWFKSFGGSTDLLKSFQASLGVEYSYSDLFFLRTGYFYEDKTQGNRQYFSVGIGLKYSNIGLNFSYLVPSGNGVTRNPLSNTLRFGLLFDLDPSN